MLNHHSELYFSPKHFSTGDLIDSNVSSLESPLDNRSFISLDPDTYQKIQALLRKEINKIALSLKQSPTEKTKKEAIRELLQLRKIKSMTLHRFSLKSPENNKPKSLMLYH